MATYLTDTPTETTPPPAPEVREWDTVEYYVKERTPAGAREVRRTGVVSELRTHKGERQFRVLDRRGWLPVSRVVRVHEQKDEEE